MPNACRDESGSDLKVTFVQPRSSSLRALAPLAFPLALTLLILCAWGVYRPGLTGDFLFDDFGNLPALGATGPIDNPEALARYLTSGTADPTGRPLTLASFLIDAHDWPASPYPFKVTNVLLHLLNGALLACVLLQLGRALRLSDLQNKTAALFGAGAWLLHPLLVSTTLYVVQREAMLPGVFVLLGTLGWISGRKSFMAGLTNRGTAVMAASVVVCTILATLCKANGVLLPLLLLLIEWIVLTPNRPSPAALRNRFRLSVQVLLVLPSLLLAVYMLSQIPAAIANAHDVRDWSILQRLLSEPRALIDYLALLWWPRAHSIGLFTDGFAVSRDWLHPWTTVPCMLMVLSLFCAGFFLRKKHPAVALALLFFFAGQMLESTWLPLELYYEHRNYLPAMMMFWPLGLALSEPGRLHQLRRVAAIAALMLFAVLTHSRASVWGNGYQQALIWAAFNPDSARAQVNAAEYDMAHGRPRLAAARLRNALPSQPREIQIPMNLIGAECQTLGLRAVTLDATNYALSHSTTGAELAFKWFNAAIELVKNESCPGLDSAALQAMLDSMRRNPRWRHLTSRRQDIEHLQGTLYLAEDRPVRALQAFNRALSEYPKPDTALDQAAALGASGCPSLGLKHLDYFETLKQPAASFGMPRVHAWVLARQDYWPHETARLRQTLESDAAAGKNR